MTGGIPCSVNHRFCFELTHDQGLNLRPSDHEPGTPLTTALAGQVSLIHITTVNKSGVSHAPVMHDSRELHGDGCSGRVALGEVLQCLVPCQFPMKTTEFSVMKEGCSRTYVRNKLHAVTYKRSTKHFKDLKVNIGGQNIWVKKCRTIEILVVIVMSSFCF